jgi:hypothetical protein
VTETTKARIRIRNFSGSDPDWVYQAGDGSKENFTIAAEQVDLTILSIATSPASPQENETITVTVTVQNQGTGNIGGSFFVDLYKDSNTGPGVGEFGDLFCEINGLAAGATKTCTIKIAYDAAGTYKMWAQVDADGYIPETNETNNIFGPQSIKVITGSLISDLVIQSITTNPVSPQPHQSVEVTVTFRNQGTGHTANPFAVDFYYDRASAPTANLPGDFTCNMYEGLETGVTTTCVDYVTYPAVGSYNMWAQIDTNLEVTESNETNNIFGPQPITVCSPPAAPSLSSPANGATGVSTTLVLDWGDVSGATSYDVQVCSNNTCSTVVTSANVATSQWTVSPALAQGTLYYWRVKANNSCGSGPWTSIRNFTTICPLPAAPSLSSPANGATGVSTTPALDWADVSGATSYDVQVCSNNTCSTVVTSANVATSTWTVSPALSQGTQYYWRVKANNSCGSGSWSSIRNFTTLLPGQLLGDLNNDTSVDISDVILDLRIALGLDPAVSCSNINGDTTVDISDVILTLRMALGLDPKQPCT